MGNRKTRTYHLAALTLLAGMLCIYMAAVFYINLSQRPNFYDADMYADILVSAKMWEQKTFLPEDWIFSNQVYVLATPSLAAVIYGIAGDPFWSMAAASCVMAVLVIVSFDWMLKAVFQRPAERLFGIISFLAVVVLSGDAISATNGWQLFFTMCSYYACYAINAFLAFGCYLRSDSKVSWVTVTGVCLLSFAVGIQSLRQTAVMACPLMAMELIQVLRRLRQRRPVLTRSFYVAFAISVSNLAGAVIHHFLDFAHVELFGEIRLASLWDIPGAIWESVQDACSLFFYYGTEPNLPYLLVLLLFVLLALFLCFKTRHEASGAAKSLFALFLLSVLVIAGIDTVTTMEIRSIYYFMLYPFLAFLAVYVFANRRHGIKFAVGLLLCVTFCFSCWTQVIPACRRAHNRMYDINYQISADLLDEGYTTVYSRSDEGNQIAVASRGKIQAGFWSYRETPFVPVQYLCDPEVYTAEPEQAAYVFYGRENAEVGIEKARTVDIELIPVAEYPEKEIFVYTAPVNLMQAFSKGNAG